MFRDRHYVPVLRLKRAEREALTHLHPTLKPLVTPLLECPRRILQGASSPDKMAARLEQLAKETTSGWVNRRMFCDFGQLPSSGIHLLELFSAFCGNLDVTLVPVVGMSSVHRPAYRTAVESALAIHNAGICLRVSFEAFRLPSFASALNQVLNVFGSTPHDTDLIIDRGLIGRGFLSFAEIAHLVPRLHDWRSLTILAGSFPRDLRDLQPGHHRLRREEWLHWLADRDSPLLERRPAFGDYTIQHPIYREPPVFANFSASIRYTTPTEYLILRGEGVRNEGSAGYSQWPAQAMMLTDLPDFRGPAFSYGDAYIADRAMNPGRTGSAGTWLMAGISHHVTVAAQLVSQVDLVHDTSAQPPSQSGVTDGPSPGTHGL